MRKMLFALACLTLALSCFVPASAKIVKDTETKAEEGYVWYDVDGFKILIPNDYVEVNVDDESNSMICEKEGCMFSALYQPVEPNKATDVIAILLFRQFLVGYVEAMNETVPDNANVESLNYRGYSAYLTTFNLSKLPVTIKSCCLYDTATSDIYVFAMCYYTILDGTNVTNDFYKMLSTSPDAYTYQNNSPQLASKSGDSAKQDFVDAWSLYFQGLEDLGNGDYNGFVNNMADAMESAGAFEENNNSQNQQQSQSDEMTTQDVIQILDSLGKIYGAIN